jgi:hypothetical protein
LIFTTPKKYPAPPEFGCVAFVSFPFFSLGTLGSWLSIRLDWLAPGTVSSLFSFSLEQHHKSIMVVFSVVLLLIFCEK